MSGICWMIQTDNSLSEYDLIAQHTGLSAGRRYLQAALDVLGRDVFRAEVAAILKEPLPPVAPPAPVYWRLPVGEGEYQAASWYVATIHDPNGKLKQPIGDPRRHLGLDINLDRFERGDAERRLGLSVFAMAEGEVVWKGTWTNTGVVVLRHFWQGRALYTRYAHVELDPTVILGRNMQLDERLGGFADWKPLDGGDHLHLDMCWQNQQSRYNADSVKGLEFIDPVDILREACAPGEYEALYRRWAG